MNIPEISPRDALDRLQSDPKVRLVDVRQPEEFTTYRAAEATLLPLDQLEARHATDLDKDGHYLIVCERGGRSAQACAFLASQGYANVLNVSGGMSSWAESGLPIAKG